MLLCLVIPASAQLEPWTLTEPEPWTRGSEPEPKPEPQTEPKSETAAAIEPEPLPESEPKSETAAAIEPEPSPESESKSETAEVIEPELLPESEPKPETAAAIETEPLPEYEPKLETAEAIEPEPSPVSEPKPQSAVKTASVEKADKYAYGRMKVGARLAYTNSSVKNMEVWYQDYDKDLFQMPDPVNYSHHPGKGHGFEIQAMVIYGLIDWLSLYFSPGLAFRNPFVSNVAKTREWALTVPLLLDYQILDLPLYLLGGIQLDVPFGSKVIWDNKGPEYKKSVFNRNSADFGVVLGVHLYLLEDYFIDFRYNIGLTSFKDYDGKTDSRMNQLSVGVGYDLTNYLMLPW